MKTYKLVITTIDIRAFEATGHVVPSSYIINLSKEQLDLIYKLEKRGETIDHILLSEEVNENA